MLTIGQLADYTGVTVRAVRHYHERGLLAEPERDASGYRRYGAQAVVDLIQIKTLAEAGVPLSRVKELISAPPPEFSAALAEIDHDLRAKIRDLTRHRRQIADLARGGTERLFLPPEIADILVVLRAMGVSERTVRIERDGWILAAALTPESVGVWAKEKAAALADPRFRDLYLACDEAFDWDPADPQLADLAARLATWDAQRQLAGSAPSQPRGHAMAMTLMNTHIAAVSLAWTHLSEAAPEG
ncbi:MAG TPA: MerR family transcriptional regulator [Streptosporangiaceae bacterium]|jgi:DNA-binding transcriptional MerR regulator|nr:MerR family transcriptional regulator [Streptosporangiaceae bacterium]